jgi:hypothetical protein
MEDFDSSNLEWEDFRNAYSIWFSLYDEFYINEDLNLEAVTKRAIERNNR